MNPACRLFPEATIVIDSAILNYRYAYDTKGLMSSRSESVINRLETYKYDNLDRLTQVKSGKIGQTGTAKAFSYENNGNIEQYGSAFYSYQSNDKPHAVRQITPSSNVSPQTVTYNFYNQPKKITEGNFKLELLYDADRQRSKGMKLENNKLQESVFYISKYFEKEMDADSLRNNHYIYDDNSVVALHITTAAIPELTLNDSIWLTHLSTTGGVVPKSGITNRMYNIHTDHLGSYCVLTDAGKNVVQNNRFDPWGNNVGQADFALTYRGFTGHEHYPEFKIINMNSRLYDPVIGRFFSPDNYVQIPEFTQSFNRYSYCLNNPLKYKDPTGNKYELGEYRDEYGKYLGWDGKKDDNIFIVEDSKSIKTIKQNDKAGKTTDASSVKIKLETTLTELRESMNVLTRTIDNGGFREEVSVVTPDGKIHRGEPGPVTMSGTATVGTPIVPGNNNTLIHSHPTGETAKGWWLPTDPGPNDPSIFSNYQRNIVVGKFVPAEGAIGGYRESGAVFYNRNADKIGTLYYDPIYRILGGKK